MAVAAAMILAPAAYAQYEGHEKYNEFPESNIGVNKYVVNSAPDENGEYTLRLETFTTGSVEKHAIPTDFVLVMDNSGSMLEDCLYGKDRPDYVTGSQMADEDDDYYNFLRPAHSPENLFLNRHCYSYGAGFSMGDPGQAMSENNSNVGTGWSYFASDDKQSAHPSLYYYLAEDDTYYKIKREKSGRYCRLHFTRTNGTKMYIYSTSATNIVVSETPPPSDTNNDAENKILLVGFNGDNIYRPVTRVEELKPGFEAFIQSIYEHNQTDPWADGVTKNQVAIVSFSQGFAGGNVSNPSLAVPTGSLTYNQKHQTRVIKDFAEINDSNVSNYKSVIDDYFSFRMGTQTFYGLRLATRLLQKLQNQSADMAPVNAAGQVNRNKVVILFTDGEPKEVYENGNMGTGSRFYTVRYSLQESELIKAKRTSPSGSEINGKVFSIDFAGLPGAAKYLQYVSSNYYDTGCTLPDGNYSNNPPIMDRISYTGTEITPEEDRIFYMDANHSGGLEKAFAAIADANTGDTSAHLVAVDVISSNFELPEGVETSGKIKLYTAQCIGTKTIDGHEYLAFAQPVPADTRPALGEIWLNSVDEDGNTVWTKETDLDIDNDISCVITGKQLVFKGFDFANLWCGKDEESGHNNTQQIDPSDPNYGIRNPIYRGFKLIAEFPIIESPAAVGGPEVPTNVIEFSGVYGSDENGVPQGNAIVNYPSSSLVISVKLTIQKTGLKQGESASFTIDWKPVDGSAGYTEYTTFVLTGGSDTPEVRFVNLDPNYYYRVRETGWSWSYDLTAPTSDPSTDDLTLTNPIVFENRPKSNAARHAEAMAVNKMRTENSETTTVQDVN